MSLDRALLHGSFYHPTTPSYRRFQHGVRAAASGIGSSRGNKAQQQRNAYLSSKRSSSQAGFANATQPTEDEKTYTTADGAPPGKKSRKTIFDVQPQKDRKRDIEPNPHHEIVGKHPFRTMVTGFSGSGKTTLVRHLYDNFWAPYFDEIHIWSPSFHLDDTWKNLKRKPTKIHTEWNASAYLKVLHDNAKIVERQGVDKAKTILQIVDDFAADKGATRDPALREVAFNSRHANHSSVWLSQSYVRYDPDIRKNLSMLFAFRPSNENETKALTDEQTIPLLSKAQFREILNEATREPYSFLVVDKQAKDPRDTYRKRFNMVLRIDEQRASELANMRGSSLRQAKAQQHQQGQMSEDPSGATSNLPPV